MTEIGWLIVAVLVLWAGIVAMRRTRQYTPRHDEGINYAELEEAEREVREMDNDTKGRPLDEGVGDDWGPGTPKPPYV